MSDRFFLDTNILVYSKDLNYPDKQKKAESLIEKAFRSGNGCISNQVLHEFYLTVTKKLDPGLDTEQARTLCEHLVFLSPFIVDISALRKAWELESAYSLSFWDSLITASAHRMECSVLYSEDMQDGMTIEGIKIQNPFF